jgi:peptidoglycan/xylan/chitin deacetylase (PgdA/CDA1 family)
MINSNLPDKREKIINGVEMHSQKTVSPNPTPSRFIKKIVSRLVYNNTIIQLGQRAFSKTLTVINYHRIGDPDQPGFDSFRPNISAHPDMFRQQMEYLIRWFNVIEARDLIQWLKHEKPLPPNAALITFDDGYLDNYTEAYPILREYDLPALIFLTAGHIDTDRPFYWDLAAYCFHHTTQDHIVFPGKKEQFWSNNSQKEQVSTAWIESMKKIPDVEKKKWVEQLPSNLNVSVPANFFRNLMMNWDQIREMNKNRIEFGGHTINHPILSKVPLDEAFDEIAGSKQKIEHELGREVQSFAYPNGMTDNFNSDIEMATARAKYQAAFTLLNGPTALSEVRKNPYAIRRIFISHMHTLPQFSLLTNFINRYRK